jgi:hypothetical protein
VRHADREMSKRAQMEEEECNGRPLMPWRAAISSVLALIVI